MADYRGSHLLKHSFSKKLFTFLVIVLCLVFLDSRSGGTAGWERASPCSDPTWGWAGNDPVGNTKEITIADYSPQLRYVFHGEIAWDTSMGSTQGEIRLKKPGENNWNCVERWSNPPGRAKIKVDVTRFITGNGIYSVEWKYQYGKSGVCIIKSDILPDR
jgi:hypothetical protein